MVAVVITFAVVAVLSLFAFARVLFGAQLAVLLTAAVGYCFAGPPGAGVGVIAGLVMAAVTWLLASAGDPD